MTANAIVAATYGSEESLRAVEWAAREAVLHGAPLRIVSAASVPTMVLLQIRPDRDAVAGSSASNATGPWPPRPPGPPRSPPACSSTPSRSRASPPARSPAADRTR